jgi:predicted O-linked N-acetylglucosamine transferase (SPINDLY family)
MEGAASVAIGPAAMQLLTRGMQEHQAGRLGQAVACYRAAIGLEPTCAELYNNLGLALDGLGQRGDAAAVYRQAIGLRPSFVEAHFNLGLTLANAGQAHEAVAAYRRALALKPGFAEAHYSLGNALRQIGRLDAATASFQRATALKPDYVDALNNLGVTLRERGELPAAAAALQKAVALAPGLAEAWTNLGLVLQALDRGDEAASYFDRAAALTGLAELASRLEQALAQKPDDAEAMCDLGTVRKEQGRRDDAARCYRRAAELKPGLAAAHYNLGLLLQDQGRMDEADVCYRRALAADPLHGLTRIATCMAHLPIIAASAEAAARHRAAYAQALAALCDDARTPEARRRFADGVGAAQPFFLAYQGRNDRDLQAQYGAFVCSLMAERFPPASLPPPPASDEPIRVGIVSGYFCDHSNWKIPIKGWLSQLDRRRFDLCGYYLGQRRDNATRDAESLCRRFVMGRLSLEEWRAAILADRPHVLIYPEIGMHPLAPQLAALRLAPVQCNSWGHPETSGFPTLDYYLSSDLMEPADADAHYTERLVRLPNLSIYCERMEVPLAPIQRSQIGLRPAATVYWCGQSVFKYLPEHDDIFPRIAREAGDCQFVFLETQLGRHVLEMFLDRLGRAFAAYGLDAKRHCVVRPYLSQSEFQGTMACCDVFLDSIGWSGCNSTLESLARDLPIVTLRGALMRGRHSAAILDMMGLADTVAERVEDYVALAVRMARDPAWRAAQRGAIAARKDRVWHDRACIVALEDFLERAVRRGDGTVKPG